MIIVPRIDFPLSYFAACALAAFALAGCANDDAIQQLNQNQFTLRGMIANDRQEMDSLQRQVRALKEQMGEVSRGGAGGASSDQVASINDRLNKLESQVSGLQAGMSAAPLGVAPSATAPATPAIASATSGPSTTSAPAAEPSPTWPQELDQEIAAAESSREPGVKAYREGLAAMQAGKYPTAVAKFTELSHHYPKSSLVTPAEYFTANALYESGKYDQSILQFNDVVMRDPKGKYASQSLLREAQAFIKLNDNIDARLTLQKLLADHADSPEAPTATAIIKTLAG